ncbi:Hypothetical predicted protein [Pelobates cultripes]|uniref:CD99 antigen n=1 Tax=Pelobates cultripes TaxID=61616 RepID=A0AAD1R0A6_PELCU|nr:Hypothetical predicted protein [Pelobates cultripes]
MFRRLAILCLLLVAVEIRGQEFDLSEALDKPVETTPNKPASPTDGNPKPTKQSDPKPQPENPGFHLEDAFDLGPEPTKKPAPKPKPENPGTGGGSFSDADLLGDNELPNDPQPGEDGNPSGGEQQNDGGAKPNVIAGILSAVGVAAFGAVSSFIAYQKKKLCFKGASEDLENVNMDNKGDQVDPQAQNTLLPK